MAPKDGGAKAPETFLSVFVAETLKRLTGAEADAASKLLASFRETIGFPRGASYTDHKRTGAANVSLTVEARTDGNGYDVILSPMAGSRAVDAAWRLAGILACALYPTVTLDGGKKDHKRPERAKVLKSLGISWAKGSKAATFADWPTLPWPEALYSGSGIPNPKRLMVGFLEPGKLVRYYSLLADGSQRDEIQKKYAAGEIVSVKSKVCPAAYQPPVAQAKAA